MANARDSIPPLTGRPGSASAFVAAVVTLLSLLSFAGPAGGTASTGDSAPAITQATAGTDRAILRAPVRAPGQKSGVLVPQSGSDDDAPDSLLPYPAAWQPRHYRLDELCPPVEDLPSSRLRPLQGQPQSPRAPPRLIA
jgi:hypothetical protein